MFTHCPRSADESDAHSKRLAEGLNVLLYGSRAAEDGAPGDENVSACFRYERGILRLNTAVHLQIRVESLGVQHPAGTLDLVCAQRDVCLSSKAGVYRHDENEIYIRQDLLQADERRGGVQGHPGFHTLFLDVLYGPVQVGTCLHVNRDDIRPGFCEIIYVPVRRFNHQVHVQHRLHLITQGAKGLHYNGTHRDVRDEVPIHHVDVNPIGAGLQRFAGVVFQTREIGGENGGSEVDQCWILDLDVGFEGLNPVSGVWLLSN